MLLTVFLTVLLIAIVLWFSFKFGRFIENGPPGSKRAAVMSFMRKHRWITVLAAMAILLHGFGDDIGPFFSRLVWAKANRAGYVQLQSTIKTNRPQAVAAIYLGTRECIRSNSSMELPGFVDEMLSQYTLLTFDGWFSGEDMHHVRRTQLLPKYHAYDAEIAALTRKQRRAFRHLMDGTSDDYNTHYGCVARTAVRWLNARKPDNRGKV